MEEIYFNEEAKDKLYSGIEKLYKAVSSTMGPAGKTVVILDEEDKPIITKDGVSVARAISFKDPVENIGAQLVKQAAEKTVLDAGDGTTTATVLAYSLIKNLKEFDIRDINKALDEIIPKVIDELKKNSKQLKKEDIKHVASISANNNIQIGELIQQAFNFSDIVKVESGTDVEDKLITVDGMKHDVSYFSKHFITNNNKGICELDKPYVLILDCKLEKLDSIKVIIDRVYQENKSLLIITEHINEVPLRFLESAKINNDFKVCVIKSPGFGPYRKDLLEDISKFTNASVIRDINKINFSSVLGSLESCNISKSESILIKNSEINLDEEIENLSNYSKTLTEEYDKDLINKRIELLKAKISIIKVGGKTEIEMREKRDRYDDAVLAVSSALEEGIVEGGGVALVKTILPEFGNMGQLIHNLCMALTQPYLQICNNGCKFDFNNSLMFDKNIIDPLKVTRCALENAVSVARTILSTDTVVLNRYLWKM